jgi:glyoxylase-like metal-dependent hydrolase (beta-lactamase superfamily II)
MSKAPDNTQIFPNATIYVPSNEFKFWLDSSIFAKLPDKQHGLPKRLQAMFPLFKDTLKQYEWDTEVVAGIHSIAAPGHTPGHTAFVVGSGKQQLMVLSDTTNMPALFAKHPNWHGAIDADPVLADDTAQTVRPCRGRQVARHRLPLPVSRRRYDHGRRRGLYLCACCIVSGDAHGNGHRLHADLAVFDIVFNSARREPYNN